MIEIQIINILSLLWKHNTFLAVYCTLVTDLKTKKRAKQISKQDKTKTKKKNRKKGKRKSLADFENGTFRLTWPHIATTPLRMVTWFDENFNAFYIKLPPANDRGKRSSHTIIDWKNDSQQSDEIKANWNQATDTKKQCKTHFMAMKEHAIQSRHNSSGEVGRKTLAYVFLSRFPLLF